MSGVAEDDREERERKWGWKALPCMAMVKIEAKG
jgi:hypothetical protein